MKITCPSCSAAIPSSQLNVETDVACCTRCDEAFAISTMVAGGQGLEEFDFADMPNGAWFTENFDGWTIGVSARSWIAFFLVPFMCVWSGFSLGGIYGEQIAKGEFDMEMSLFGIPFILGTLLFGSFAVMSVVDKVTVTVENELGRVFMGVGPIGWTRKFDWASITGIGDEKVAGSEGGQYSVIVLEGKSRLKFGGMLPEPRRFFLLQGLRKLLASRPI